MEDLDGQIIEELTTHFKEKWFKTEKSGQNG
jgi:hypothetical protein